MKQVIYLHGFASGPESTKACFFRSGLERAGVLVTVPDLAGGDFGRLTITGQLDLLARTAPSGPVCLIGSSMGGYLASLYAARHPEVERLVLLAPAFRFERRWRERLGPAEMGRWQASGGIEVYHYAMQRPCRIGYGLIEDAAKYEDFPDFRQPALIFHGAHDDIVPAAYSEAFAAAHPNVTLEVMDSGHDLLNVRDEMLTKVRAFLGC